MMRALLDHLRPQQDAMVGLLGRLVRRESPSFNKAAVDRCAQMVAKEWRKIGAQVALIEQEHRGAQVRAELWNGTGRPTGQVMVLGHMDTVYDVGTLAKMPFRVAGGRAYGPGTFDMKAGLVMALYAASAAQAVGAAQRKNWVFLWTSDEEIGSDTARKMIEQEARRSDTVLVLEPAFGKEGRLKTSRKGVGEIELLVTGRASHAGINPQDGVNAIHELALQIERVMRLNNPQRGTTVNVDVIEGGTRSNVIAESARAQVDVRVTSMREARQLEEKFQSLYPFLPGAKLEVHGAIDRPPLERTAEVVRLFRHAQQLMSDIGFALGEASTGGGSDGNFTAALGIPTLDGLGAVGDGAHSQHEHIVIRALPGRAALIAGLLATL
ncbi:MAG: M20 family metallopeptidase [Acidobacteria bacterium]|nr:M20 family metallopeptidase [Acidobacteriota bacterium]